MLSKSLAGLMLATVMLTTGTAQTDPATERALSLNERRSPAPRRWI